MQNRPRRSEWCHRSSNLEAEWRNSPLLAGFPILIYSRASEKEEGGERRNDNFALSRQNILVLDFQVQKETFSRTLTFFPRSALTTYVLVPKTLFSFSNPLYSYVPGTNFLSVAKLNTASSQETSVLVRYISAFKGRSFLVLRSYEKLTTSPLVGVGMCTFSAGTVNICPSGLLGEE